MLEAVGTSTIMLAVAVGVLLAAVWGRQALTVTAQPKLEVVETLESTTDPFVSASAKSTTTNNLAKTIADLCSGLTSSSDPPVTKQAFAKKAMSGGAGTIDFRAAAGLNGGSVDANGLKPQFVLFYNPPTNANDIAITEGASNGHPLLGSSFSVTLKPKQWLLAGLMDAAADVGASDKTIDIAGTGSQELHYHIVFG